MANGINIIFTRLNRSVRACSECGSRRTCSQMWEIHGMDLSAYVCGDCEQITIGDNAVVVDNAAITAIVRYGNERYIAGREE